MSQEKTPPNVIVDFCLEQEFLFLKITNHSDAEATHVKVSFHKNVYLRQAKTTLNKLPIFEQLLYFAPHKEIKIFIDQIDSFFKKNKTPSYRVKITCRDVSGKQVFTKTIYHNLNIYRNLPIVYQTRP